MTSRITVLLLLALCLVASLAATSEIPTDKGVYVLSESNFDEFVQNQEFTVVEFYAPWCGHCKKLAPEYAEAAARLAQEPNPVKIAKVDCTVETALCDRFGVRGYPTLKDFVAGKDSEYNGPRNADGIVKYVKSKSGPASNIIHDLASLEKYKADDVPTAIFYGSESSPLFAAFNEAAKLLRNDLRLGHTHSSEIISQTGHSDVVVLHQAKRIASKLEKDNFVFSGLDKESLVKFLKEKSIPLAGEINSSNEALYKELNLPVVKVAFNIDWKRDPKTIIYYLNRIRKVAADFVGKLSFAIISSSQNSELRDLGIESDVPVSFYIHDLNTGLKYRADEPKFTQEALRAFASEFVAGNVSPFIKSEPIPDNSANDVKVVVGKNFDEIVFDPTKDVLLEAYAPWCGHCKTLAPKYEELGQKMSKYSSTLTIAKIDATANHIPPQFEIQGFPTIFFVPANNKVPIKYEGAREVEDFVKFIRKHASLPLSE